MNRVILALGLLMPLCATAQQWQFETPLTVSEVSEGSFIHLDASGRRSVATSDSHVGVTWEDNRNGVPTVYVALKEHSADHFSAALAVSEDGAAYEPAIAALGGGNFVIGWESEDHVWLRVVSPRGAGEARRLSRSQARQVSFSDEPNPSVAAVWAEKDGDDFRVALSHVSRRALEVHASDPQWVDDSSQRKDQLYPAVVTGSQGTLVAWEDRREGATRIYTAFAPTGQGFEPFQLLNDFIASPNPELGRGTGAMRVTLSASGSAKVLAAWLDKRHFEGGYDVYAALSADGGRTFGTDEKVQDLLGENMPQWHAAGAIGPQGMMVTAWDDQRDGTPDVWFSWRGASGWSDDYLFSEAAGAGAQSSPALDFDSQGRLHGVWISRAGAGSQLYYVVGRPRP